MEQIKQAVERAKASAQGERLHPVSVPEGHSRAASRSQPLDEPTVDRAALSPHYNNVVLNGSHLEQHRIVAHNVADPRSKAFDMLRTQVLQAMDQKSWQVLAVTSPTEGCGKTVTAINLALSIARQPERSVLLVDLDLQRPSVANYLGIKSRQGVLSSLEGRTALPEGLVRAQVNSCELFVLPCEAATVHSSELIGSRNMNTMLQDLKRLFRTQIIVFDMPPLLQGDEVLATLPRVDGALLVAAVGVTTLNEIKECNRHLQSTEVIRLVLNKSHETIKRHYY
jgi:Mrp family chromosome partitioning ATPase